MNEPALNASGAQPPATTTAVAYDLPRNYSLLLSRLEQLALGLDSAFANLSLEQRASVTAALDDVDAEPSVNALSDATDVDFQQFLRIGLAGVAGQPAAAPTTTTPLATTLYEQFTSTGLRNLSEADYSRVVSDIWIGVVLTLLICSVVFFICSCFLYHKFQQWKNSYHTNPNEPVSVEILRHYPPDFEAESLPSYTIVSGLPTYDDALEEFRKAGIILAPPLLPVLKIFEAAAKDNHQILNFENLDAGAAAGSYAHSMPVLTNAEDSFSLHSTCSTCGAISNANTITSNSSGRGLRAAVAIAMAAPANNGNATAAVGGPQVIELSPEQLAQLSQKRLSLQIAFTQQPLALRRNSRPRVDLYREVNRNNMLRLYTVSGGGGGGGGVYTAGPAASNNFAQIHRASSSSSLAATNARHMQHRGSLF